MHLGVERTVLARVYSFALLSSVSVSALYPRILSVWKTMSLKKRLL